MSFTNQTKPTQGDATKKSDIDTLIDNVNDLNTRLLAVGTFIGLKNASFESDTDSDGTPDSWAKTLYTGGSFTLDSTDQQHGLKAAKFTSPGGAGNGGGYLETSDFFEVSPLDYYRLYWLMKSSVAGVNNKVQITFYTAAQASISTTDLYDSSSNPTSWTPKTASVRPPSTARYAKIRITGCHTSSTTAGSTWFDDFWMSVAQYEFQHRAEYNLAGSFVWKCPSGVTQARITAIGGGGGGGNVSNGSGGGGGGGAARSVTVVSAGTSYTVTVGAGGAAGADGVDSVCNGVTGAKGLKGSAGGTGGTGGSGTGDEVFAGANGIDGSGSAASPFGIGGHSALGGGGGGANAAHSVGCEPGGGGSGTSAGANGRVIIEY
jgi:hypothetical protein